HKVVGLLHSSVDQSGKYLESLHLLVGKLKSGLKASFLHLRCSTGGMILKYGCVGLYSILFACGTLLLSFYLLIYFIYRRVIHFLKNNRSDPLGCYQVYYNTKKLGL